MIEALFLQRSHSFFLKQAHFPKNHMLVQHCKKLSLKYENRRSKSWVFSCDTKSDCEFEPKFTCNRCRSTPLMGCCHRYAAWPQWPWRPVLTMKHTLLQPPPDPTIPAVHLQKAVFFVEKPQKVPTVCLEVFFETPPQWQFCLKINQRISLIKFWMCLIVWCQWSNFAAQPLFGIHACHFLLERLP